MTDSRLEEFGSLSLKICHYISYCINLVVQELQLVVSGVWLELVSILVLGAARMKGCQGQEQRDTQNCNQSTELILEDSPVGG